MNDWQVSQVRAHAHWHLSATVTDNNFDKRRIQSTTLSLSTTPYRSQLYPEWSGGGVVEKRRQQLTTQETERETDRQTDRLQNKRPSCSRPNDPSTNSDPL